MRPALGPAVGLLSPGSATSASAIPWSLATWVSVPGSAAPDCS
jgi:hypothetical protein